MNPPARHYKNRILSTLPKAEINRLAPNLSPVDLQQEQVLADGTTPYAYFLEDGIASVVVTITNGDTVETGIIGVDGVVGLPILFGTDSTPGRTFMQIAGSGFRINRQDLKDGFERPGELRQHLLKYIQAFLVQTAQTAACNRLHNIEERLSRWLLACRDRMQSDRLQLTHDFLGQMLGAPRTTVTLAAGLLHRAGMIDYTRGVVTIQDRVERWRIPPASATGSCATSSSGWHCFRSATRPTTGGPVNYSQYNTVPVGSQHGMAALHLLPATGFAERCPFIPVVEPRRGPYHNQGDSPMQERTAVNCWICGKPVPAGGLQVRRPWTPCA